MGRYDSSVVHFRSSLNSLVRQEAKLRGGESEQDVRLRKQVPSGKEGVCTGVQSVLSILCHE